jgi:transposase
MQARPDGIASRALEYLGAVPARLVPDNLKSAVARACRYEPQPNATYQELASHYGTAILPAPVRWPRAKVEAGVLRVERGGLARLRYRSFCSRPELNAALRGLLEELNPRPFNSRRGISRPCSRCPRSATCSPRGASRGCPSTTPSRLRVTTTRCPTRC